MTRALIDNILWVISISIVIGLVGFFIHASSTCSDRGGTLIRTVWTGWKCVKVEELK